MSWRQNLTGSVRAVFHGPVRSGIICALIGLFLVGCSQDQDPVAPPPTGYPAPVQTEDGWSVASPTDVGMDGVLIDALLERIASSADHHLNGLVVAKDGKLVLESYYPGQEIELDAQVPGSGSLRFTSRTFDRDTPHLTSSCAKGVVALLAGIALDQALLEGMDASVFAHFPDYVGLATGVKGSLTLGDLLTMRSGLPWDDGSFPIWDPRNDEYQLLFNPDPTGFVLAKPAVTVPGTSFEYNSGAAYLVAEMIAGAAEEPLDTFAARELFAPLDITDVVWQGGVADDGMVFPGGLYLRPRDMTKIGHLLLDGGSWGGREVVSAQWVAAMTEPAVTVPPGATPLPVWVNRYGRMWWRGDIPVVGGAGAYLAAGWGGQLIVVLPEVRMVVTLTGDNYLGSDFAFRLELVTEYLLPAAAGSGG